LLALTNHRRTAAGLVLVILAAAASGCHRTPSGQVAATVDGDEITVSELRMEMAGAPQTPQMQQAALQQLIGRKLLLKEAERQKLDDGPAAAAARSRAEETALAQLLGSKLASQANVDTSQNAIDQFISSHPTQFAGRKLISAEQLVVSGGTPALLAQISGLKSLPAVEAMLTQANVPFIKTQAVIDTAVLPPEVATKIASLSSDQIFAAPAQNGAIQVSRVLGSRPLPLAGDEARTAARSLIERTRNDAAQARMRSIVEQGQKRVWIDPSLGKT
jgi:EpsD family peptidyl-prolyl cis-trans isomerase